MPPLRGPLLLTLFALALGVVPTVAEAEDGVRFHVQTGHQADLEAVAFSPDDRLLATGAPDHSVRLWHVKSGKEVRALPMTGKVTQLAFSPDGAFLAVRLGTSEVAVWKTGTWERKGSVSLDGISHAAISNDGRLALALPDGLATVVPAVPKVGRHRVMRHDAPVIFAAALPNDDALTVDAAGTVRSWALASAANEADGKDLGPAKVLGTVALGGHASPRVALSADAQVLALVTAGGRISLLRTSDLGIISETNGAPKSVSSIALSGDGGRLLIGSSAKEAEGTVTVHETQSLAAKPRVLRHGTAAPNALAASSSKRGLVAVAWPDVAEVGLFAVLDAATGEKRFPQDPPVRAATGISMDAASTQLAVGTALGFPSVWPLRGDGVPRALDVPGTLRQRAEVSQSGDGLLLAATSDRSTQLYDAEVGGQISFAANGEGPDVNEAFLSSEGAVLVVRRGLTFTATEVDTGRERLRFRAFDEGRRVTAATFHLERVRIAAASGSRIVARDLVSNGRPITMGTDEGETVRGLAFDRAGDHLLASDDGGTVTDWDVRTRKPRIVASGLGPLRAIALTRDEDRVVVTSPEGAVGLVDRATGEALHVFETPPGLRRIALIDGPVPALATVGTDAFVHLWELRTGRPLGRLLWFNERSWAVFADDGRVDGSFPLDRWRVPVRGDEPVEGPPLQRTPALLLQLLGAAAPAPDESQNGATLVLQAGHTEEVMDIAFDARGERMASLSGLQGSKGEADLRVWDVATGKQAWSRPLRFARTVAFDPDGQSLAVCTDETLTALDARTGATLRTYAGSCGSGFAALVHGGRWLASFRHDAEGEIDDADGPVKNAPWSLPKGLTLEERLAAMADLDAEKSLQLEELQLRVRLKGRHSDVVLVDRQSAREVLTLRAPEPLWNGTVNADGTLLAATGRSGRLFAWRLPEGTPVELPGRGVRYTALGLHPAKPLLVAGSAKGELELWDLAARRLVRSERLGGPRRAILDLAFSADGQSLSIARRLESLDQRDEELVEAKTLRPSDARFNLITAVAESPNGVITAGTASGTLPRWDGSTGIALAPFGEATAQVTSVAIHPSEPVISFGLESSIATLDLRTGVLQRMSEGSRTLRPHYTVDGGGLWLESRDALRQASTNRSIDLPSDRHLTVVSRQGDIATVLRVSGELVLLREGRERWRSASGFGAAAGVTFSPDGRRVAVHGDEGLAVFDAATGRRLFLVPGERGHALFVNARTLLVVGREKGRGGEHLELVDAGSGRTLRRIARSVRPITALAITRDGKRALLGDAAGGLRSYELSTGRIVHRARPHETAIRTVGLTHDNRLAVTTANDRAVKLTPLGGDGAGATLAFVGESDYVLATPGAYLATRGTFRGVGFRKSGELLPMEQFDLQMNRPDLVLRALGYAPEAVLAVYRSQHARRLSRLGLERAEAPAGNEPRLSVATGSTATVTRDAEVSLTLKVTAGDAPLQRLHLFVNDVPLHGRAGQPLQGEPGTTVELTLPVALGSGRNKLQAYAQDAAGRQSLRWTRELTRLAEPKPRRVHVFAVGVSKYRNAKYDLQYAAKDAGDIAAYFRGLPKGYGEVRAVTLLDEAATRTGILALRAGLEKTQVDDLVVLFLAGHGVLGDAGAYYFAPTDMDMAEPSARGIAFDELDDLLDGIPARQKLLLLDTCHAGELEGEEVVVANAGGDTVTARSYRAVRLSAGGGGGGSSKASGAKAKRTGTALLGPEAFLDLRRGSGATVIAAAGGAEYALESSRWRNGVFTHSVLAGLRDFEADANGDGIVQFGELREFVTRRVTELTAGRQRPVSRRENGEFDPVLGSTRTEVLEARLGALEARMRELIFGGCTAKRSAGGVELQCDRLRAAFGRTERGEAELDALFAPRDQLTTQVRTTDFDHRGRRFPGRSATLRWNNVPNASAEAIAIYDPGKGEVAMCVSMQGDRFIDRCHDMVQWYFDHGLPEGLPATPQQ